MIVHCMERISGLADIDLSDQYIDFCLLLRC